MWQALFAAAVAGSTGFVAKRLFRSSDDGDFGDRRNFGSDRRDLEPRNDERDEVFRFSSGDSRSPSMKMKKKNNKKKTKKKEGRVSERSGGSESEKRNYGARRYGLSLKRRKICRNLAGKRAESSLSSSQVTSLFSWGLGVGAICMMSAGKSEFRKLSTAVTETAKVVEELKTEISKRKPSHGSTYGSESPSRPDFHESKSCSPNPMHDGECGSSVLTEEHSPRTLEMDQLEAELELELQKLPWCAVEDPELEDSNDFVMNEFLAQEFPEQTRQDCDANHNQPCGNGISPEELDQKLCHLVIQRQESQIEELESELTLAQRKLREKEAQLQALRDCVKGLTQISLSSSTLSDDENEPEMEQDRSSGWDYKRVESDSRDFGVGMKRPSDSKLM